MSPHFARSHYSPAPELKDPSEYQSLYELDNAHRGFEPFDYDAVDLSLAMAEGRIIMADEEEEAALESSREEQCTLMAFVFYMIDKADYRLRLDVAICALGMPFGSGVTMGSLAFNNGVSRQAFHRRVVEFKKLFSISTRSAEALIRFISILINSKNYRLRLEVAIASFNIPARQGETFTSRAKKFQISKQAFTKQVLRFQRDWKLPPTREQKTLKARESYKIAAKRSPKAGPSTPRGDHSHRPQREDRVLLSVQQEGSNSRQEVPS
jgi:hypothetical protein